MRFAQRQDGFSLIELMVALVLVGIILAMGMPDFKEYNDNRKIEAAAQRVVADLRLMRSIAIGQHQPVKIIFDTDTASYSIYTDEVGNGTYLHYRTTDLKQYYAGIMISRLDHITSSPIDVGNTNGASFGANGENWTGFSYVGTTLQATSGPGLQSGAVFLTLDQEIGNSTSDKQTAVTVYGMGTAKAWRYNGSSWRSF